MPSSATITAFYNFSANTKARATQVNTNFDVFRGHIIPVSPSTATGANNTYDLGSSEYRWRNLYSNSIYLGQTTSSWKIEDSTLTGDSLIISKNSNPKMILRNSFSYTTTADIGEFAASVGNTITVMTTGSTPVPLTNTTITISTMGRPVMLSVQNIMFSTTSALSISIAAGGNRNLALYRDSTVISSTFFSYTADNRINLYFNHIDIVSAGTYKYYLADYGGSLYSEILNYRLIGFEL